MEKRNYVVLCECDGQAFAYIGSKKECNRKRDLIKKMIHYEALLVRKAGEIDMKLFEN